MYLFVYLFMISLAEGSCRLSTLVPSYTKGNIPNIKASYKNFTGSNNYSPLKTIC